MTDRIEVRGIRAFGHHGVLEHEQRYGQEFAVDVSIDTDFGAAAATDDLELTIDYGAVATLVHSMITGEPCALIETLADRIAADPAERPGHARPCRTLASTASGRGGSSSHPTQRVVIHPSRLVTLTDRAGGSCRAAGA